MMLTAAALLLAALLLPQIAQASSIPASLRGDGQIAIYRPDKDEHATVRYRDAKGRYLPQGFEQIATIFRCRLTEEQHEIDAELIEILDAIQDHFDAREVRLISAYRSPERNALMRRQGRRVARDSLHMRGMAADIELPGVSRQALRDFAFALHQGGVGFYRRSGFVHVDSGEPRAWGFTPRLSRTRPASAQK